mgnify:CR=1 FL=1
MAGASPAVIGWQPPKAYKDSQGNYFDNKGNSLTYTPGTSGNEDWNKRFGTLTDAQGNLYGGGSFGGGKTLPAPGLPPQGPQLVGGPAGRPIMNQPAPVNRFAPPNAPGVRPAAAVSTANQARPGAVTPNRYTRKRVR